MWSDFGGKPLYCRSIFDPQLGMYLTDDFVALVVTGRP